MRFSIGNMMIITALIALAITPVAHLGVERGVFALFLIVSTIVICLRFIRDFNEDLEKLLWTVSIAVVVIPLDLYFVLRILNSQEEPNESARAITR